MPTPLQLHHDKLKAENPDAVLFFQLGDFYELFGDDAVLGARVLGISLTARHKGSPNEMKMCGFPMRSAAPYIKKFVGEGYRVAIADQVTDENGVISRQVTRVITPGVNLEEADSQTRASNLGAVVADKTRFALAFADIATGEFRTAVFPSRQALIAEAHKVELRELLMPTDLFEDKEFCDLLTGIRLTPRKKVPPVTATDALKQQYGVADVSAFGFEHLSLGVAAAGMVLLYLQETQKSKLEHLSPPKNYRPDQSLQLDAETIQHLEIFTPLYTGGDKAQTLWGAMTKPKTAGGKRLLQSWLIRPLMNIAKIKARQTYQASLLKDAPLCENIIEKLKSLPDVERLVARLATGRATPVDLARLRLALDSILTLAPLTLAFEDKILQDFFPESSSVHELLKVLESGIKEEPNSEMQAGGIIKKGYNAELDELIEKAENADSWLAKKLGIWKTEYGIPNLKVKYSRAFGYSLEVSTSHKNKVPESWTRRQTLVNAERFRNEDLVQFESEILTAKDKANQIEYEIFQEIRKKVVVIAREILSLTKKVSFLDCMLSFCVSIREKGWTIPQYSEENQDNLEITNGAHPVVQNEIGARFIKNSLVMKRGQSGLHLITGPNMAGKSTFLRQNAIIVLLGQVGGPVPAEKARLPIIDRVFTRVGASDNLGGGKSTFYIEMNETARILRSATEKSFIILDEIGRGTSTYDGLSIAWAITEDLAKRVKAWTLFATHYHELVDVVDKLKTGKNYSVAVKKSEKGLVFLHQIKSGGAEGSFGVDVAHLAGVPPQVVAKARNVLASLEQNHVSSPSLFTMANPGPNTAKVHNDNQNKTKASNELQKELIAINLDELTPLDALNALNRLKKLAKKTKID